MAEDGPKLVYRAMFWRTVAAIWVPFALYLLWDVSRREWTISSSLAVAVIATVTALLYAVGWRPVVIGDNEGVLVRNPFRTATIPWNAVEDIDVTDALRVHTRLGIVRAWSVDRGGGASNTVRGWNARRVRAPGIERQALAELARLNPADTAVARLTELWRQRSGQTRGVAVINWAWPTIVAVVGFGALSIFLAVTG